MTQTECYELLKKKKKWMTTQEIGKELNINPGSALQNLKRLLQYGEVLQMERQYKGMSHKAYSWKIKEEKEEQ